MTDFLDRLIARSLDPGVVLNPRPLGWFERPPLSVPRIERSADEPADLPTLAHRIAAAPPNRVAPLAAQAAAPSSPVTTTSPSTAPQSRAREPADPVRPVGSPPDRISRPRETPAAPLSPAPRPQTSLALPSPEPPVGLPVPARRREGRASPLPATAADDRPKLLAEREPAQDHAAAPSLRPPRRAPTVVPGPAAIPAAPALLPAVRPAPVHTGMSDPAAELQITPLLPPEKSRPRELTAADAAPTPTTVQVTIGRIEIRAAVPAAPRAGRPRRQPAVMSLDEYLKQRGGGSR
jgi:hypothetical protein